MNACTISEKKALEEANATKERELRKRQKMLEKQERRAAYEAMEEQKRLMAEEAERNLLGWIIVTALDKKT
jgi:hypothetical protein